LIWPANNRKGKDDGKEKKKDRSNRTISKVKKVPDIVEPVFENDDEY
jgi:hypothetical protein